MWYLKSSAMTASALARSSRCLVLPRARPLREVELEAGRLQHIHADLLVLVRAAARDAQAAQDDPVTLDRHAALGGDDGPVAHAADLGEEHRVGAAPVLEHLGRPLHDGG